jgi:hypothetical protein
MPVLPSERIAPDHRPNRSGGTRLAASVIGPINMPEVETPIRNWANTKLAVLVAKPLASAPTMVPANKVSATGRTPKRSIAVPTGICSNANEK